MKMLIASHIQQEPKDVFARTLCHTISVIWQKHPNPDDRFVHTLLALSKAKTYSIALEEWSILCLTTISKCTCSRLPISNGSYIVQNSQNGAKLILNTGCCLEKLSIFEKRPCRTCNRHKILHSKPEWIITCRDCSWKKARYCISCKAKRIPPSYPEWKKTCVSCTASIAKRKEYRQSLK